MANGSAQERRRNDIVRAAAELLGRTDYDHIQMKEVAERAGVALATLYRYFDSKEHLYAAVLVDWAEAFFRPTAKSRAASPAERIRARLHRAIRAFEQNPNFVRLEIVLQGSTDPAASALFREFSRRNVDSFRAELADLPEPVAADVVAVVTAVMARELMAFQQGWRPAAAVYANTDRAVDLIFDGPAR